MGMSSGRAFVRLGGAAIVFLKPIHSACRSLRAATGIHLPALQTLHPLAPSCFGGRVQLGNADGMGGGVRQYSSRSRGNVGRRYSVADRL